MCIDISSMYKNQVLVATTFCDRIRGKKVASFRADEVIMVPIMHNINW